MSYGERVKLFFQESRQEFKRVNWPDWATTRRYTLFVIALSLGISVFLGVLDYAFVEILKGTIL